MKLKLVIVLGALALVAGALYGVKAVHFGGGPGAKFQAFYNSKSTVARIQKVFKCVPVQGVTGGYECVAAALDIKTGQTACIVLLGVTKPQTAIVAVQADQLACDFVQ